MTLNLTLFLAAAIVSYEQIFKEYKVPEPKKFVAIAIVWILLGIVAELGAYPVAAAMAWGLLLMMAYSYLLPSGGAPRGQNNSNDKGIVPGR